MQNVRHCHDVLVDESHQQRSPLSIVWHQWWNWALGRRDVSMGFPSAFYWLKWNESYPWYTYIFTTSNLPFVVLHILLLYNHVIYFYLRMRQKVWYIILVVVTYNHLKAISPSPCVSSSTIASWLRTINGFVELPLSYVEHALITIMGLCVVTPSRYSLIEV